MKSRKQEDDKFLDDNPSEVETVKYSKAEKALLKNLTVVKIVTLIGIGLNLFLPIMSRRIGMQCPTQWFLVICYIIALINAIGWQGWTTQYIPLLPMGFIRIFQIMYHLFISSTSMNFTFFTIVAIYDSVYILMLLLMKSSYEFVKE